MTIKDIKPFKRILTITRHGRTLKLGRKAAYSNYINLLYTYDTPQGVDEVEKHCRYILTAIDEGYNFIYIAGDMFIKTY
jgi:hypothetical protein